MSILAVDFGSVNTRAVLLDKVDGIYQLVARAQTRTTDGYPVEDISVGLDRVIRDLSAITGRTFTSVTGAIITPENPDRAGVDAFVATASLGRPMRTVIVGLVPDVSVASGKRAAASTYAQVIATIDLEDSRTEEERLNTLLLTRPDVVLVVGGVEGGAATSVADMLSLVKLAATLTDQPSRPSVIYAGNSRIAPQVQEAFKGLCEVFIAPNVRPDLHTEQLEGAQAQFARAFDVYKERSSQDLVNIIEMTSNGIMPTAQAYTTITRYLGETRNQNVATLDVGSAASVTAVWSSNSLKSAIRPDLGIGHNAVSLIETVGTDAVRAWLPFHASDDEIWNYAANKALYITSVPQTLRDMYLEHALLRASARAMLASTLPQGAPSRFDTIIAAGASLTNTGSAGLTALLALDILQPVGMSHLYADPFGLVPALGAAATVNPQAAVQVLDGTNLEPIGTAFSLSGQPAFDRPAMHIKLGLPYGERYEHTVMGGHIWIYNAPATQTIDVAVRAVGRGVRINGGQRMRIRVQGGSAGLIFDARGRALVMDRDLARRASLMSEWIAEVTGQPIHIIDPSWFEVPPESGETQGKPKPGTPRKPAKRARGKQEAQAALEEDADDPLKELRDATLS